MPPSEVDGRVNDLEAQLAFQEDTIQKLNDVIVACQKRIDRLESTLDLLVDQIQTGEDINSPEEEPPPPRTTSKAPVGAKAGAPVAAQKTRITHHTKRNYPVYRNRLPARAAVRGGDSANPWLSPRTR